MIGDDRARFCDECHLHVYNIAELTRAEAETLIATTEGRVCARIYRRSDGTVITRDCPVGLRALRRRMARSATAIFAAVMALATSVFGQKPKSKDKSSCRPQVMMTRDVTQAGNSLGAVTGTVLDPNGAVISGVEVTITDLNNKTLTTSTDEKGTFLVAGLEAGAYKITLKHPAFKKLQIVDVKLKGNEKLNVEVALEIALSSVTVGIIAYEPLIDTPGTLTINEKMIQRLPIHED
jgi:hypothetical protein